MTIVSIINLGWTQLLMTTSESARVDTCKYHNNHTLLVILVILLILALLVCYDITKLLG